MDNKDEWRPSEGYGLEDIPDEGWRSVIRFHRWLFITIGVTGAAIVGIMVYFR